jgi:hypothetical protein
MTIFDKFSTYDLTQDQETLLSQLDDFFKSDDFCFLLKGYAGTGKTFMMKGVADYLKDINQHFIIAAPTGRAAKVISQKTSYPAYTIHKTIYKNTDLREYKVQDEDGTETYKFFFSLNINSDSTNTVYIIDESSMISNQYSESEFFRFGSGYLLKDFFEYVNRNNGIHNRKIIFIGDNAQLPPVNMAFSPALDKGYLSDEFSIKSREFQLTDVHRQKEGSGILENATMLRDKLDDENYGKLILKTDFDDINPINEPDFLDTYLNATNRKIDNNVIVIAHSNKTVKNYNDLIRSHFFPNKEKEICIGDVVAIQANNYNYEIEILNGDFGVIKEVFPNPVTQTTTLKNKDKQGNVTKTEVSLTFRKVMIELKDSTGKKHFIKSQIIENLLFSDNRALTPDESKAIYTNFWIRYPKLKRIKTLLQAKSIGQKSKELEEVFRDIGIGDINDILLEKIKNFQKRYFAKDHSQHIVQTSIEVLKKAFITDEYFNALQVKFGYAITCHKAQGGEWNKIILNCKHSSKGLNSEYFRWLYTGITRTKEDLFLLNMPNIDIKMTSTIAPVKKEEMGNIQENISILINDLLNPLGIKVDSINEINNGFNIVFSKGSEATQVIIYYKKDNKISSINKSGKSSDLQNEICNILEKLKGTNLNQREEKESGNTEKITFDEKFLEDFYNRIVSIVSKDNICVEIEITRQYLQRYKFTKGDKTAFIDFHYNGRKQFKRYTPQTGMSLDNDFLNSICELIGKI